MNTLYLLLILFAILPFSSLLLAAPPPPLLLAQVYQPGISLADYWVSEKLDGVRAYWTGKQLISRNGNRFNAPPWFIEALPDIPLDGELWIGPQQFDRLSGIVRKQAPVDAEWRQVKFMLFDLPKEPKIFDERLKQLQKLVSELDTPWVEWVPQYKVESEAALNKQLEKILAKGGEGLMLHRGSSLYLGKRGTDLLKLKPFQDAEAVVIGLQSGKGKYANMMGSLLVRTPSGVEFRLGSGFSDAQRQQPPLPGTTITYRYSGLTATGKPRFARFLRVREEI